LMFASHKKNVIWLNSLNIFPCILIEMD
jgi:hypothetical protein